MTNLKEIENCTNCDLCKNQRPLLDNKVSCDVMWVGLSAKKVLDVNTDTPLGDNTNSGKLIKLIEEELTDLTFYKTNLVKCLPLDNNKLRYPTTLEMEACIHNLILEVNILKPKVIFALGKVTYNFISKYLKGNFKLIYIEHPSYIFVYKRKFIDDYIEKVVSLCRDVMPKKFTR